MKKMYLPFLCLVLVLACAICFSSCTTVRAQSSDVNETSPGGDSAVLTNHFGQRLDELLISIDTSSLDLEPKSGYSYTGGSGLVFTILRLYDDSTFFLTPSTISNSGPSLLGSYYIEGDRLILVFEKTNLIGDTSTDLSALKISIVINDDDSLTIVANETCFPGYDFRPDGDIILTKAGKKAD